MAPSGEVDLQTQVQQCIKNKITIVFDPKDKSPADSDYKVSNFHTYLGRSKDNIDSRNRYRFWTFVALLKLGLECTIPDTLDKFRKTFFANKDGDEVKKQSEFKNHMRRIRVAWQLRLSFGWGVACWVELLGGGDGRGLQSLSDKFLKELSTGLAKTDNLALLLFGKWWEQYDEFVKEEVLKCKLTG